VTANQRNETSSAFGCSFRQVPKRIVLDVDETFNAVRSGQQPRSNH
jgi:hypothetical protein